MVLFLQTSQCWWWGLTDIISITRPSAVPDMTEYEMVLFLAITIQMGELHRRPTDILLGNMGSVLHAFLQQHNKTRWTKIDRLWYIRIIFLSSE
jgi:hypothetical protein